MYMEFEKPTFDPDAEGAGAGYDDGYLKALPDVPTNVPYDAQQQLHTS